jgi:hypothetical protein
MSILTRIGTLNLERSIPTGFRLKAQGWRVAPTLGLPDNVSTPSGLRLLPPRGRNPFGVDKFLAEIPRVARFLATLGFVAESRWDSKAENVYKDPAFTPLPGAPAPAASNVERRGRGCPKGG